MEKPNLNRMWEAFIRIGVPEDFSLERVFQLIRTRLHLLFTQLQDDKVIEWYSFLIHSRAQGVPTAEDDRNYYFHIRFGLRETVNPENLEQSLSVNDCLDIEGKKIRKIIPRKITGIDESLLKNEAIEEAWRILGEQSEWFINMLESHKDDVVITINQVKQFLHFYSNMSGLSKWRKIPITCPYCHRNLVLQMDTFFMEE